MTCVCEICQLGPMNGVTVYRTGEKGPGKDPHWRCLKDMPNPETIDPEVQTVVTIIESAQAPNKH